ncbi:MAG TPA: shikimate dehydrogenase [Allosphingosinicella sp.]|jgi:shikimate dehydrogenase
MAFPYAEVIGDPIAHSKSPLIHKFWLGKLEIDGDYRATRVSADELPSFLEARRADPDWRGCNVTMPHKQTILALSDWPATPVSALGAANCVTRHESGRLKAHNTDWQGFLEPLQPWLRDDWRHRMASVLGAGGAAAAVTYALDRSYFTVVNFARDPDKALAMRTRLRLLDDDDDLVADMEAVADGRELGDRSQMLDLLVNATPLGMEGFPPLPFSVSSFPSTTLVYDLVYHPLETDFLRAAREAGMATIDGLSMLVAQAAFAFELFFFRAAPRQYDPELRELLTR